MMALLEATKGVLVLAAGLGLFALAHRDVQLIAEELVRHLHLNPAREFPRIFLHLTANLNNRKLWLLAAGAIVYSMMRFIEAYGLWHDWKWMKWFAVFSGAIYIPVELSEVLHHFNWDRLILLGANALVVAFIFFHVAFERNRNIRKPVETFSPALDRLDHRPPASNGRRKRLRPIGSLSKVRHLTQPKEAAGDPSF